MRSKFLYLITSIFLLVTLTQCEDSLTITANQNQDNDLAEVSLASPEDGSDQNTAVAFDWSQLDKADSYEFQLSSDSEFTSIIVDSLTEESSFQIKGLPSDTTLYWQVRPVIDGEEGPWSAAWQFFTESTSGDTEPLTTDLTSPSDGSSKSPYSVQFSWTAIASASAYNVQVASDQEFSSLVIDQEATSSSYETTDLSAEQTFYWRVKPVDSGEETQWSDVFQFSTLAEGEIPAPAQVSPNDGATNVALQPTFEWEAVDGADYYILHANSIDPTEMVVETEVEGTTFTPESDLAMQTDHDWRVRAVIGDTQGEWSEIHSFTTGSGESDDSNDSAITLNSPSDGSSYESTNLTLDWETVSGASEYQVQVAQDNSFSSFEVDEAVGESSYSISSLDYNQTYYWRVQVNGEWSVVYSFTTESENNDNNDSGDYANSVEGDRQALMDLYEATGGSGWNNDSGWGSGNPDNSWHGIEVDAQGRVTSIDLSGNNLSGSLPESLGNLSKVRYFNVKQNNMTGQIPSSIGGMASLTHLLLNGRTHDLDIEKSYHPGKPHGGSWADQRSNNFTGEIPRSIGNLENLQWFEMSGSDVPGEEGLTGTIPSEFNKLSNLKGLSLAFNSLTSLPNLSDLSNLERLILEGNPMEGHGLPSWVGQLTNLRNIWIPDMQLGGAIPDLSALTNLRIFQAPKNDFSGELPSFFIDGTMSHINMLALAWNNLSGSVPEFGETNLAMFTVDGNSLSGKIPSSIADQGGMINLGLGWNNFEGELPSLSSMSRLRYLRANDNNFTGTVPMVDTSNEKLQFINMQENNLSQEIPRDLADVGNLPKFRNLDVRNNSLTDSDLQPIINELQSDGNLDILNY